jgi:hypothetical protein
MNANYFVEIADYSWTETRKKGGKENHWTKSKSCRTNISNTKIGIKSSWEN